MSSGQGINPNTSSARRAAVSYSSCYASSLYLLRYLPILGCGVSSMGEPPSSCFVKPRLPTLAMPPPSMICASMSCRPVSLEGVYGRLGGRVTSTGPSDCIPLDETAVDADVV